MKKIKRTITVRKVEFTSTTMHEHINKPDQCPLCHSPIHAVTPANNSAVEIPAAEIPLETVEDCQPEMKKK